MDPNKTTYTDAELDALLEERRLKKLEAEKQEKEAYLDLRDDLVLRIVTEALKKRDELKDFKVKSFEEVTAFAELVRKHENKKDDWKNNFELKTRNGNYKLIYSRQRLGSFDERAQEALSHIQTFIEQNLVANPAAKKLIEKLLARKNGSLDIKLVQKLYDMENDFQDEHWRLGISILKSSWVEDSSADYIRFYERNAQNTYELINLNFASV